MIRLVGASVFSFTERDLSHLSFIRGPDFIGPLIDGGFVIVPKIADAIMRELLFTAPHSPQLYRLIRRGLFTPAPSLIESCLKSSLLCRIEFIIRCNLTSSLSHSKISEACIALITKKYYLHKGRRETIPGYLDLWFEFFETSPLDFLSPILSKLCAGEVNQAPRSGLETSWSEIEEAALRWKKKRIGDDTPEPQTDQHEVGDVGPVTAQTVEEEEEETDGDVKRGSEDSDSDSD